MESDTVAAKEAWLSDLVMQHPSEVDAEAYCVVLRSISRSNEPGAPHRAEQIISRMTVEPNDSCYCAVMEAWVRSESDVVHVCWLRAERWFMKIKEPTLEAYHLLLDILSKGRGQVSNKQKNREQLIIQATKAEQLLYSMKVPYDTQAFNYVIRAWLRVHTDPELMTTKVRELLRKMEALQQENPAGSVQPNTKSYCMGMQSFAKLALHRVKSRTGDGRAELKYVITLLNYMKDLQAQGQPDVVPNTVAYNILIAAYARLSGSPGHENAPLQAEEVLRHMVATGNEIAPDQLSFTNAIHAWVNAKRERSAERAAYWLDKLWQSYEANGEPERLRPGIGIYNAVMKACRDDPRRTEEVFAELLRAEKSDSSRHLRPNSESFSFLIHSLVKHDLARAVMWLEELLRRESESNTIESMPSVTSSPEYFEAIISHAARNPSVERMSLAMKTIDLNRASRHPITFRTYVKLARLGLVVFSEPCHDMEREEFICDVIRDCRSDGLVSSFLVRAFANGPVYMTGWTAHASQMKVAEYFSDWPMPASWTRNVPPQFRPQEADTIRVRKEHPLPSAWEI